MLSSGTSGFTHFCMYQFASVAYLLLWSRIVQNQALHLVLMSPLCLSICDSLSIFPYFYDLDNFEDYLSGVFVDCLSVDFVYSLSLSLSFFLPCSMACEILAAQSGIESGAQQ